MKKFFPVSTLIASAVLASFSHGAVTITVVAVSGSGKYVLPATKADLPNEAILHYGTLDFDGFQSLSATEKMNPSTVFEKFNSYGSTGFSGGQSFFTTAEENDGTVGEKLYTFVADNSNLSRAGSFGLFSNLDGLWTYPAENGSATLTTTFVNQALIGSLDDSTTPQSLVLALAVIPEPSFLAFLVPAFALGFGAIRRRR